MEFCGPEVLRKHWRHVIARWAAYPVVWCVAGVVMMSWYLHEFEGETDRQEWAERTREKWMEVTRYVRDTDPYGHPVTAHPGGRGSREMLDDRLVEIEMLQTGHGGHGSLANTVQLVTESVADMPPMPVVNGEVSYEGIGGTCWQDVQRLMFWVDMLNVAAGHTYGANGLWQMSTEERPYGPSPHGMTWGNTPWKEAAELPGSEQVGLGRRVLERYDWWRLEPEPDAVEPHWSDENYYAPHAAVIPGQCIIIYMPRPWSRPTVRCLQPGAEYRAFYVDPMTGAEYESGQVTADEDGIWPGGGRIPIYRDLLLIVEEK
jgi:hypothetical protein